MSLDWCKDEKLLLIIELLKDHPGGLGKRETWELLKGQMARNTVDEKLAILIQRGFILIEPDDKSWHRGQSKKYFLIESLDLYIEFLERIMNETEKYIFTLNNIESSKKFVPFLTRLIESCHKVYNLAHLMDALSSWNYEWINNMSLMSEILNVWYSSFRIVNVTIGKIVLNNLDIANRIQREQRKTIEKNNSRKVDLFDKIDEAFLNFYREPKQKLDALYQDIKVNNDKKS